MPLLQIREAAAGEDWIVAPIGDLDMASAEELDARLADAAREHPDGLLIIDLGGLQFMDSAGLRVLLTAARSACNDGSRLRLRGARPSVQRVFEVSGTVALLPFE
jgi:anti-sigma B factor antagonist